MAAQSEATPGGQPAAQLRQSATVDQITDDPGVYYGAAVSVVADVEDVLGPRAFTVEDQDLLFDEELLVVSARPFSESPEGAIEADMLRSRSLMIGGTVHMFNEAAFEERLGIDLDDDRVAEWAGRPALIADRLMAWSPAIAAPWWNDAATDARRGSETIEVIAENPATYSGQPVTVGGYVDQALGQHAFVLEDGDLLGAERVLVVTREQAAGLPGASGAHDLSTEGFIWVSGTVQPFDQAELEQQLGTSLDGAQLSEWAGQPAIVATSVIPVRWGAGPRSPMATEPGTGATAPAAQGESSGEAEGGDLRANTSIDAILNAPDSYVGQTTTVNGRINQMIGPIGLVLTDSDAEAERLLVVSALTLASTYARGDDATPDTGERVEVTGEVWRFDINAVEERIGFDLDDSLFEEWSGQPFMIATAIMPAAQ